MIESFLIKKAKEIFWLSIFLGIPFIIWLYAIPTELNKRLPKEKRTLKLLYQIPFFYTLAYLPLGLILMLATNTTFEFILPFHLLAIGSIFFLMIISSSSIIKFEKHHQLQKSNAISLFFGMWYYIIGI